MHPAFSKPSQLCLSPSVLCKRLPSRHLYVSCIARSERKPKAYMSSAKAKVLGLCWVRCTVLECCSQSKQFSSLYAQASAALAEAQELPGVVVFDLDYTLWPFWYANIEYCLQLLPTSMQWHCILVQLDVLPRPDVQAAWSPVT